MASSRSAFLICFVLVSVGALVGALRIPVTRPDPVGPISDPLTQKETLEQLGASAEDISMLTGIANAGGYTIEVQVGDTDESLIITLDTGSTDLLLADHSCVTCKANNFYTEGASGSTYQCNGGGSFCATNYSRCVGQQCQVTNSYGEGSMTTGILVTDEINFGGLKANVTFVSVTSTTSHVPPSFFNPHSDGLMGLAYPKVSSGGEPSVIDTLFKANNKSNVFSFCMTDLGGFFSLAEDAVDSSLITSPVQYTPIVDNVYFTVKMNSVSVGSSSSSTSNIYTIVDSGTTLTLLDQVSYQMVTSALCSANSWVCSNFIHLQQGLCKFFNAKDFTSNGVLPNITLQFSQKDGTPFTVTLTARDYIRYTRAPTSAFDYCGIFGIQQSNMLYTNGQTLAILGDTVMRTSLVVFDKANNQVGFAPQKPGACGSALAARNMRFPMWLRLVAIGGGILLIIFLVTCIVCCCRRHHHHHGYQQVN